ncbi:MAG: tetratricopeptide repeat protein [Gammaproteobacteria bacterium]|nr:tetratricopeptide repeat protein [Gammaproteobacteria bacterium]
MKEQEVILDNQEQPEPAQVEDIGEELELVLDEPSVEQIAIEEPVQEEVNIEVAAPPSSPPLELEKSAATTTTVSDEALQLLVYKTNKRYRQRQKIIWGSLLSAAIVILLVAGTFYYYGVLEEIESLERKHKLSMQAVHAEPIKQHQITAPAEAVVSVKEIQSTQNKSPSKQLIAEKRHVNKERPSVGAGKNKSDFSVRQTTTKDPINALLKEAWLAYNKKNYILANERYESVLSREPRNRDALLGMAAIAIKTANYKKAKASYRLLLKLDPRDQVAMAAMSNIDELSSSAEDESKLKFMLQQQPTATHLNFALGNYYAKQGKWPEAQAEYFKAWQGNSENADYVYNLAVSLDQLGKKNEALRFYKESLLFSSEQNVGFSVSDVEKRIETISVK